MYCYHVSTPYGPLKHESWVCHRFMIYKFRGKRWSSPALFMDRDMTGSDEVEAKRAKWEDTGGDVILVEITDNMVTTKQMTL